MRLFSYKNWVQLLLKICYAVTLSHLNQNISVPGYIIGKSRPYPAFPRSMLVESPSVELSKIHVETEARPSIPNLDDQINAVKDLRVTFYHMRIRSFVRWHSGIASRPLKRWIILGFISLMLVSGFLFTSKESQSIVCVSFTIGNSALSFLVVFAVVLAVYIVALLLSYVWVAIIWILLFELLVIIFVGSFSSSAAWEKHRWIFLLIIILEGLTFLGAIFYYFLFVRFIKQPRINKALWKLVDNGDVLSYENRFALRGCCRRRKGTCQYIGTLDSSGKPHGKGLWYDSAGETLDGYWSHGIPSGAFFSVESESRGFATEARALMYYLARDEEVDEMFMFPRNKSSPRFGVSLTECSVSGGFFLNLPGWVSIEGPHFLESGKFRSCFKALGAYNGGTAPANISIRLTSKKVVNAVPAEVVIFIHGFNTPCSFQLQAVGQLLCMGRFPSHVKTVLFSWSSGKVPTYFSALEAASSEILHQQFIDLLVALKETGSTNFHILCHSMGTYLEFKFALLI